MGVGLCYRQECDITGGVNRFNYLLGNKAEQGDSGPMGAVMLLTCKARGDTDVQPPV